MEIARNLTDQESRTLNIKFISVNSESSSEKERKIISEKFQCDVFDEYSCEETWMIASQCKFGSYHGFIDNVWIEILDKDLNPCPPGITGELYITTLNSPAMPFIRYKIGDAASWSGKTCKCGISFPVLSKIDGRKDDFFKLKDGTLISPLKILNVFTNFLYEERQLFTDFQIVQTTFEEAEIRFVPGEGFSRITLDSLKVSLKRLFKGLISIKEISWDTWGSETTSKRKPVVSLLPVDSEVDFETKG